MNSVLVRKYLNFNKIIRRYKRKEHWATNKLKPKDRALDQFDDFYGSVYGDKWKSMRVALLSEHKYCAVVNNYGDTEKTIEELENNGAINIRKLYELDQIRLKEQASIENDEKNKIYKLDNKMSKILAKKVEKEVKSVYGENETAITDLKTDPKDYSLEGSLKNASYDASRIIDPNLGLTTSALYEYIPATKIKGMDDWVLESDHYKYYENTSEFPVKIDQESELNFPEHLHVYSYERGNVSTFPKVKKCSTGVLDKYLLDGGSLLPVLALNLKPGDTVLDMCAAPGGKSLLMLQTLYPEILVCNDVQESRVKRIENVFRQYLYDFEKRSRQVIVRKGDARAIEDTGLFNKILVDVPCTTDRHAVMENDNNFFKPTRTKERLKLPELQAAILTNALKLVKPGGTVVYATCSLSPIQNDGVVHMALKKIWQETSIKLIIKDLKTALRPMNCLYQIDEDCGLKYGHLVTPFLPNNFGPMYFCKIKRTK